MAQNDGIMIGIVILVLFLGIGLAPLSSYIDFYSRADSNTFTALNDTNVTFGDSNYYNCTGVTFYNETNSANITGDFTTSNCGATLEEVLYNNTLVTADYTITYYETYYNYLGGITRFALILLGLGIASVAIIKSLKNKK